MPGLPRLGGGSGKPGRTRDDWHLVVNVMHGYGMDLTPEESKKITKLLFDLRKGIEREAG
jgi:hypothetical protein